MKKTVLTFGFISGAMAGGMMLATLPFADKIGFEKGEILGYTTIVLAALMVFFGLANAGLPSTSGFVGEFFVILGTFHASAWLAFFAATTLILGAAYTLWMIKRVVFGEVANDRVAALEDVSAREFWMLMVLAVAVLIVGEWPAPLVNVMDASVGQLLIHVVQSKL